MAPTQPKKPVGGAYGIFLTDKRPEYGKLCAGQPAMAVSKMAGEAWKKLSDAVKAPYQKRYTAARAQFEMDMAKFTAAGGVKAQTAGQRRKEKGDRKEGKLAGKEKDKNAPKKLVGGAYGVYLSENRDKIKKSLPAGHAITDVAKGAGAQWKALSDAAKKPYEATYQKNKVAYAAALEAYNKSKPAVVEKAEEKDEDDEAEDEDEDEEDEDEDEDEEDEEPAPKKGKQSAVATAKSPLKRPAAPAAKSPKAAKAAAKSPARAASPAKSPARAPSVLKRPAGRK